jgi:hypothetical protein
VGIPRNVLIVIYKEDKCQLKVKLNESFLWATNPKAAKKMEADYT